MKTAGMKTALRFWRDESGSTAIEYALIGMAIFIVIVVSVTTLGTKLNAKFAPISSNL